jgi:hypothetical protein
MDDAAARALKKIVAEKGRQILLDVRQCQALMVDHSPLTRRENMALIEALKADIPRRLLTIYSGMFYSEAFYTKLAAALAEETVLSTDAAQWAVRSWADVLNLHVPKNEPQHAAPGPASPPAAQAGRGPAGLEPKPVTSPTAAVAEAGRTPERTLAAFALSAGATAATAGLFLYFACSLFSSCLGPDTSKQLVASVGLVTVVAYSLFWTVFK